MSHDHNHDDHQHSPTELALAQILDGLQTQLEIQEDINTILQRALLGKMVVGEHVLIDITDLNIPEAPAKAEFVKVLAEDGTERLDLIQ